MFRCLKHFFAIALLWFTCSVTGFAQTDATPLSTRPTPIEVSTPNFVLTGVMPPADAVPLLHDLERFRFAVLDIFDGPTGIETDKIRITYIEDIDDFDAIAPSDSIAALYFQSVLGPRILINGAVLEHDLAEIKHSLFHEYMHHLNFHYLGYKIPVWLNEGLAEYYATFEETTEGKYLVGQNLEGYATALEMGNWTPITVLFDALHEYPYARGIGHGSDPSSSAYFYAQSWLIAHYFLNTPGALEKLRVFVGQLDPLKNAEEAFITLFDMDYIAFEEVLKAYMRDNTLTFDVITPSRKFVGISPNVTETDAVVLLAERYLITSLLNTYDDQDPFLISASKTLDESGRDFASVKIADITNAIQENALDTARLHLNSAQALFPENAKIQYLDALVTYASVTDFSERNLQKIRQVLKKAIHKNPEKLRLRAYLLSTFRPEGSANNMTVKTHIDYLINANFEVRNPELATTVVPYLEDANHYSVSDRALNIAEIWLTDSQQRSAAYRMKADIAYSRSQD